LLLLFDAFPNFRTTLLERKYFLKFIKYGSIKFLHNYTANLEKFKQNIKTKPKLKYQIYLSANDKYITCV